MASDNSPVEQCLRFFKSGLVKLFEEKDEHTPYTLALDRMASHVLARTGEPSDPSMFQLVIPQPVVQTNDSKRSKKRSSNTQIDTSVGEPITDIQIIFSKKEKDLPEGYELMARSSTKSSKPVPVNLNKSRNTFLCFKRGGEDREASKGAMAGRRKRPITALCVVYSDTNEEPPYGFQRVDTSVEGLPADLNSGPNGNEIYLCTQRGDGPPLIDLSVQNEKRRKEKDMETLPPGFHSVLTTPFGNKANLNSGHSSQHPMYISFHPDTGPLLEKYEKIVKGHRGYPQAVCILAASLYCNNAHLVVHALDCFKRMLKDTASSTGKLGMPDELLNLFISSVCDAVPVLMSYFNTQTHTYVLKFLLLVFKDWYSDLSLSTVMRIFEICFLLRHEDKKYEISKHIIDHVIGLTAQCKPCHRCSKGTGPLCCKCQQKDAEEARSPYDFCAGIVQTLVQRVSLNKDIETAVTRFQRHEATGLDFRCDVAGLVDRVFKYNNHQNALNRYDPKTKHSSSSFLPEAAAKSPRIPDPKPPAPRIPDLPRIPDPKPPAPRIPDLPRIPDPKPPAPRIPDLPRIPDPKPPAPRIPDLPRIPDPKPPARRLKRVDSGGGNDDDRNENKTSNNNNNSNDSNDSNNNKNPTPNNIVNTQDVDNNTNNNNNNTNKHNHDTPNNETEEHTLTNNTNNTNKDDNSPSMRNRRVSNSAQEPKSGGEDDDGDDFRYSQTASDQENSNSGNVKYQTLDLRNYSKNSEEGVSVELGKNSEGDSEGVPLDGKNSGGDSDGVPVPVSAGKDEEKMGGGEGSQAKVLAAPEDEEARERRITKEEKKKAREKAEEKKHEAQRNADEQAWESGRKLTQLSALLMRSNVEDKEEKTLQAITLMCCKFAAEHAPFNLKKSEKVKRKVHGLGLLLTILQKTDAYFLSTPGSMLLLRRFVVPSLATACVTDVPSIFRIILHTFIVLWDRFKETLMVELGVFLEKIFCELLLSPYCSPDQKKDIVDVFLHILKSPQAVINLFYNYDNGHKHWTVYETLLVTVSKLTEGVAPPKVPLTEREKEQTDVQKSETDPLQRHGLKLLVLIMQSLAQWIGVLNEKPSAKKGKGKGGAKKGDKDVLGLSPLVAVTMPSASSFTENRSKQSMTWSLRHDQQKADSKIMDHALKLARTDGLKGALKYLQVVNPSVVNPTSIAKWLYTNDCLDKSEVGDVLGALDDKIFTEAEYKALRWSYVSLLDFTGLSFDAGLRLYLTDCGFRLPGEAQKIDRILEVYCEAFCRDNSGLFRSSGSAFIVAFSLIMLNTELHDPRLKMGKLKEREPMTLEQFISNLRGVDEGNSFPRPFLVGLYQGILDAPIEWKGDIKREEEDEKELDAEELQRSARDSFELFVRRTQAFLKTQAFYNQSHSVTSSTEIVKALFEVSWFKFMTGITACVETKDVDVLHFCLDGLAFGSVLAISEGLETEREAFSRVLAKIIYIERSRDKEGRTPEDLAMKLIKGEHLNQDWHRPLGLQAKKAPARACTVVLRAAREIKKVVTVERQQAVLRKIQAQFNSEIVLVEPGRFFVKQGKLVKIAGSSEKRRSEYTFFLFSDLLVYASDAGSSKFKIHRVIHLSLCRLVDLRSETYTHAFKIASPQKSVVVCAPNKKEKQQWVDALVHYIKLVHQARRKYMQAAEGSATPQSRSVSEGASVKDDTLRRYSTFIGRSESDLLGSANRRDVLHCKLCIRYFAVFRRRAVCRYCEDTICNDCCTHKMRLPGSTSRSLRRVCDACFGALKGMVGDQLPVLTVSDQ